jgi:hypothetical protein
MEADGLGLARVWKFPVINYYASSLQKKTGHYLMGRVRLMDGTAATHGK